LNCSISIFHKFFHFSIILIECCALNISPIKEKKGIIGTPPPSGFPVCECVPIKWNEVVIFKAWISIDCPFTQSVDGTCNCVRITRSGSDTRLNSHRATFSLRGQSM
jgi:hypothetical protein